MTKSKKKQVVHNMVYESKHKASIVKGIKGPKMIEGEEFGTCVLMQGGGIRSAEGALCMEKKEEREGMTACIEC